MPWEQKLKTNKGLIEREFRGGGLGLKKDKI